MDDAANEPATDATNDAAYDDPAQVLSQDTAYVFDADEARVLVPPSTSPASQLMVQAGRGTISARTVSASILIWLGSSPHGLAPVVPSASRTERIVTSVHPAHSAASGAPMLAKPLPRDARSARGYTGREPWPRTRAGIHAF